MIKKIKLTEDTFNQTIEEKLEVIRLKINELVNYVNSKTKHEARP